METGDRSAQLYRTAVISRRIKQQHLFPEDNQDDLLQNTINLIQSTVIKQAAPYVIYFTGGIRSAALLKMMIELVGRERIVCLYCETTLSIPDNESYARKIADKNQIKLFVSRLGLERNKRGLYHWVKKLGFPRSDNLWCRKYLKEKPAEHYINLRCGSYRNIHIHADTAEFNSEIASRHHIRKLRAGTSCIRFYPFLKWTLDDVRDYLKDYNSPDHENGLKCSSCAYCPLYDELTIRRVMEVYPLLFYGLRELEKEVNQPAFESGIWIRDLMESMETFKRIKEVMGV